MLQVDVWSDYVCPFCWLEVPVLDGLKQSMDGKVEIRWRAFQLRPEPAPTLDPRSDYLTDTWTRAVLPMARDRGMTLKLPPVQPRSRLALEAAEHARGQGPEAFDAMHRALFRAFFEDGRDIGDLDVLMELAAHAGLEADGLATALRFGTHTEAVGADQRLAEALGVTGVPLIVMRPNGEGWDEAVALSGAQPLGRVLAAASRVLGIAEAASAAAGGSGSVSGSASGAGVGAGTASASPPPVAPAAADPDAPAGPSCAA